MKLICSHFLRSSLKKIKTYLGVKISNSEENKIVSGLFEQLSNIVIISSVIKKLLFVYDDYGDNNNDDDNDIDINNDIISLLIFVDFYLRKDKP